MRPLIKTKIKRWRKNLLHLGTLYVLLIGSVFVFKVLTLAS